MIEKKFFQSTIANRQSTIRVIRVHLPLRDPETGRVPTFESGVKNLRRPVLGIVVANDTVGKD